MDGHITRMGNVSTFLHTHCKSRLQGQLPISYKKNMAGYGSYGNLSDGQVRSFQDDIIKQDIPIVELQRLELLPLDLQAELHLRSDRTAIAYRKWLRELGLSFGIA